jgi:chromosome segregation ATPase
MLSYLCEVRTSLRSQNVTVDSLKDEIAHLTAEKEELENLKYLKDEIIQLEAEKSELQNRLEASEAARDKDRQFATDLELRLKEYVTRSEHSYQTLV